MQWLKVLTCFKSLNKFDIFNQWSKKSPRYNDCDVLNKWQYNRGVIDIIYLIHILRKNGHHFDIVEKVKEFTPITLEISNIKKLT